MDGPRGTSCVVKRIEFWESIEFIISTLDDESSASWPDILLIETLSQKIRLKDIFWKKIIKNFLLLLWILLNVITDNLSFGLMYQSDHIKRVPLYIKYTT